MVRAPRVRVPDVRREELHEPEAGFFAGGHDDRRHACSSAGDHISFWNQFPVHVRNMITCGYHILPTHLIETKRLIVLRRASET